LTLSLQWRGKKDVKLSRRGRGKICRFRRRRGKKDVKLSRRELLFPSCLSALIRHPDAFALK
ncbi:MAG TPA: hypothetical protein PK016_05655, partial [Candidatus Atribacteria bacterium]|nr:hypothetical protein [Candidatus Atribacteria bacterium]